MVTGHPGKSVGGGGAGGATLESGGPVLIPQTLNISAQPLTMSTPKKMSDLQKVILGEVRSQEKAVWALIKQRTQRSYLLMVFLLGPRKGLTFCFNLMGLLSNSLLKSTLRTNKLTDSILIKHPYLV